jgi:hypothetical protein
MFPFIIHFFNLAVASTRIGFALTTKLVLRGFRSKWLLIFVKKQMVKGKKCFTFNHFTFLTNKSNF